MYMKTNELGGLQDHRIEHTCIEDSRRNATVDHRQAVKIWDNYIAQLHDRPNRQEDLEVEREEEVCKSRRPLHLA
jgi:hypothetical protein